QILSRKLAETTARVGQGRRRGEAVALLVGEGTASMVPELLGAAESASANAVASLDARESLESALAALDDLLGDHGTVIVVADLGDDLLPALVDSVDRAVVLAREAADLHPLTAAILRGPL